MDHASHRGHAAVFNVGGGTGNGSRSRDAAKQRRCRIAHALGYQLHVGVMMGARHLIGHHAGQQRLDGRQNGDGEGVRQHRRYDVIIDRGQGKLGQIGGDGIQVPDGVHRQTQQLDHGRRHDHRHQRGGNLGKKSGPDDLNGQRHTPHRYGTDAPGGEAGKKLLHLFYRLNGRVLEGHAKKVL